MTKTRSERETIVRFSADPDEAMTVYTHNKTYAAKLIRAGAMTTRVGKIAGEAISWTLEMPANWFRWPRPRRKRRQDGLPSPNSALLRSVFKGKKVETESDLSRAETGRDS